MLKQTKDVLDGLGRKVGNWREQRRAAHPADPPSVTVPLWLVNATKFASWVATCSLIYFLWLYTLDIARDRAGPLHITHAGQWVGEIQFWFPYIVGFAIIAFGIPYVAKIAIPTFMSLSWRGNFWPKIWALVIAMAVSSVVIMGTFAVQGDTIMERDREAAVAVEGVQQSRAAIQAQIDGITADLRASTEGNSTQAQAARVGMLAGSVEAARAQWQGSYVRPAEQAGDVNTERIRRATGSAEAAAAAVARRESLRQQLAGSPTVASVQGEVVTERTSWIADTMGWLEGVRAILLSLVMDIVALMMPWIALRLEQARNRQVGMSEGIPRHAYMLTDQHETTKANRDPQRRSAQDVVDAMIAGGADPRFAADMARAAARSGVTREAMYDAETGEELVPFKGGWRRKPRKKGVPETMQMPPGDPQPDEVGVSVDGGGRIGSVEPRETEEPPIEQDDVAPSAPPPVEAEISEAANVEAEPHPTLPEDLFDPDELDALHGLAPPEPVADGEAAFEVTDNGDDEAGDEDPGENAEGDLPEQVQHENLPQREEPESRQERLLAAAK